MKPEEEKILQIIEQHPNVLIDVLYKKVKAAGIYSQNFQIKKSLKNLEATGLIENKNFRVVKK